MLPFFFYIAYQVSLPLHNGYYTCLCDWLVTALLRVRVFAGLVSLLLLLLMKDNLCVWDSVVRNRVQWQRTHIAATVCPPT